MILIPILPREIGFFADLDEMLGETQLAMQEDLLSVPHDFSYPS